MIIRQNRIKQYDQVCWDSDLQRIIIQLLLKCSTGSFSNLNSKIIQILVVECLIIAEFLVNLALLNKLWICDPK